MDIYIIAVILSIVIGAVHILGNRLAIRNKEHNLKIISFAAGVSITYIFMELIPMITEAAILINRYLFLSALVGFSIHLFIEKLIYKHKIKHGLIKKMGNEENLFYFAHHFILGIIFVTFLEENLIRGLLFFFIIMVYIFVSNLPTPLERSISKEIFLSSSTLLGTLFGILLVKVLSVSNLIIFALVGISTGILFFTITRHQIPFYKRGKLRYFALGSIIYAIIIILSWYI